MRWWRCGRRAACGALGAPARRTFVVRLLPTQQVGAGIALTNLSFQAAMLVGFAVGGVVAAQWGLGACYLLAALTFGAALYGCCCCRRCAWSGR